MVLKERVRRKDGRSVLQVGMAVVLLTLLALLTANICLIDIGRNFNAKVCVSAAKVGAYIAQKGADPSKITEAVEDTIRMSAPGGFFVNRPSLRELRVDTIHGLPYLVVATVTAVRVPAPALFINGTFSPDGKLLFYKTCIVNLKPVDNVKKLCPLKMVQAWPEAKRSAGACTFLSIH
jgi:hypothetical protein